MAATTERTIYAFLVGVAIGGVFALMTQSTTLKAQARGGWTSELCGLNSCIERMLNSLPPDRAAEAKITTWGNVTYVWYRK